jgi:hypothetical protein
MGHVKYASDVIVPVEVAFSYVETYRNVPSWAYGITSFEPLGEQERGLGAEYQAGLKLGPKLLTFQCEVTGYRPDALLSFTPKTGPVRNFTLRVDPLGRGITVLTIEVDYTTPHGIGRPLRRPAATFVSTAVRHTENQLRRAIEGSHGAGMTGHYA